MSGFSMLMHLPTVHPLLKPATEGMSKRRGTHMRSASSKSSTEPSPRWFYLQVEAADHLPKLSSRSLQASYPRNRDSCTPALSPSSDVGSPSAWSTQPWLAFAPPDLHIMLPLRKSAFRTPHWTSFTPRPSYPCNWLTPTNLNITPISYSYIHYTYYHVTDSFLLLGLLYSFCWSFIIFTHPLTVYVPCK